MTAPNVGLPSVPRILSPDEFEHAQLLSPSGLTQAKFPVVPPPFAPRDVTRTPMDPNPKGTPMSQDKTGGVGGFLTRQVVAPVVEHPLLTAGMVGATMLPVVGPLVGVGMTSLMGADLAAYAGQRAAELSLSPEDRKRAEADPSRLSGEQAAAEAMMVTIAPLIHGAVKGLGKTATAAGEADHAAASVQSPDVAKALGELASKAGLKADANPYPTDSPLATIWGDTHTAHGEQLKLAAAGGERFSGLPVTQEMRGRVAQHMADVKDAFDVMFDPSSRSPEAKQAANIIRATTGEQAARYEQAAFKLDEFRRAIDPLPDADKYAFIDAIEGGRAQANPEFQGPADTMRQLLDNGRKAVQDLGTGKLDHFIENYFPHIWQDAAKAADAFKAGGSDALTEAKIQTGGNRPMEGGKSFLKERTIPTTAEGLRMGLTPVSSNPVDLTLLKIREMQRYVMAHQSLSEMKDAKLVKLVRAGEAPPDGYQRIDDNVATIFGPRQGAVTLPEGANVAPEDVGVMGRRIMGQYYAPETVAKVVNNYLSPGLRGNAIFDAYRGIGNTLNQAQLGLSAFHLGFTSMDASVSRAALGLEYLASGKAVEGFSKVASAPVAPITNAILGKRIRAAYLNPDAASPEMQALANAVKEAGGRVRQDSFYKNSAPEKMVKAWRDGEYGKAAGYSIPALLETINRPLMEHIVPMQKLGVFGDMAQKVLADLPPEAPLADRRAALSKAWDSVDNRMGQMVYDNLFWNKTFKDLSMASVRSVGWNIGTIRELGGGLGDVARGELTHRAAYVAALPITVGMYGAAYQYLRTGEGPGEVKDYFFPKTGDVDADGNPERVQIASYMKDVFAYAGDPWSTVKHKMSPALGTIYDMLQNEDYYGDQIRNPDDPFVKQVHQEAMFVAKQFEPFSLRNTTEAQKRGDGTGTQIGQWFGITPAPRNKVRSDAQNKMAEYLAQRKMSGATPEDAEARQARATVLAGLRGNTGVDLTEAVSQAIDHQQLTPKDLVHLLKLAGSTPAQEKFKKLSATQALDVFSRSTPREKAMFTAALVSKMERLASQTGSE